MKRAVLYIILAAIVYYVIKIKIIDRGKYMKYLRSLGFGIVDFMTDGEIKTSYIYLHDYASKYSDKAGLMLKSEDPLLWTKAKRIADKYKIFVL